MPRSISFVILSKAFMLNIGSCSIINWWPVEVIESFLCFLDSQIVRAT